MKFLKLLSPIVAWQEPEAFREEQDRVQMMTERWWRRPAFMLIFTSLMLIGWGISKLNPAKHPPGFLTAFAVILICGFFFLYVWPWILRRRPASVVLYDRSIMKMGDQSPRLFKEITGYRWSQERSYYVLRLVTKRNRNILYGVPDPILRQKIEEVLRQNGLQESLN